MYAHWFNLDFPNLDLFDINTQAFQRSFYAFRDKINMMSSGFHLNGEFAHSEDALLMEGTFDGAPPEVDCSHLVIRFVRAVPPLLAFDNTKHKYLLFDTIPSPDTEGSNCITDAMSHIAEGACPKNINMVTDLVTYLTVAKLNVAIIYNSVKPLKTFGSGSVQRRMKVGKGGQKLMSLITTEDIHNNHLALNILYGDPTTADYILVYDIIHEHIEMASFPLTIRPHIYINTFQICEWIPSTGKTLVIRDYDRKISNEVPVFNVKWNAIFYVFFTIKTVPDYTQDGLVQPYACSYAIFKEDELSRDGSTW